MRLEGYEIMLRCKMTVAVGACFHKPLQLRDNLLNSNL